MQTSPKLAIVLINYLQDELTIECIKSIKNSNYDNIKIILINQLSTQDSENKFVRNCRDSSSQHKLIFIPTQENIGYAGACNLGIKKAVEMGADYICLLNNDTIVLPDTSSILINSFDLQNGIGIVGPKIIYHNDQNKIWFGGGKLLLNKGAKTIHLDMNKTENVGTEQRSVLNSKEVDFITGCALMAKREVFEKVGLLNEKYFAYFEEVDLCYRAKKAGYKIFYIPQSKLYHKVSSTTKKYFSGLINYYKFRNRLYFLKKNLPSSSFIKLLPIVFFYSVKEIVISITKGKFKDILSIPVGILHFFIGKMGQGPNYLK